jgi:hypothetical protein
MTPPTFAEFSLSPQQIRKLQPTVIIFIECHTKSEFDSKEPKNCLIAPKMPMKSSI